MNKHKFNIFPEMSGDEFDDLVNSIDAHGFDPAFPVITFEGEILDGWNRYKAAEKLGIGYSTEPFTGTQMEALDYVLRTNVRRNLSASVRAVVMATADELITAISEAVENERRVRHSQSQLNNDVKLGGATLHHSGSNELTYEMDEPQNNRPNTHQTRSKLAKAGGVSENYIANATALKKKDPEAFESVKRGEISLPKAVKQVKEKATANDTFLDDRFDPFTELSKSLGYKFQTAIRQFKELRDEASKVFDAQKVSGKKLRFDDFAKTINQLDFHTQTLEAGLLKRLVKCPACSANGCKHCKTNGYVVDTDAAEIVSHIEHVARGGVTV